MPHLVKTPADEQRWMKAKEAVSKASKRHQKDFHDPHWKMVNAIYQKMSHPQMMADGGEALPYGEPALAKFADPYVPPPAAPSGGSGGGGSIMSLLPLLALLNKGGAVEPVDMKMGGKVHGKPVVGGAVNSLKNDTVPAMLSPGEEVLPRTVTQAPNAPQKAAAFMAAEQKNRPMPMAPQAGVNPAVAAALARLKSGGISPNVLAALHMAHPPAAQALAQANNIHPAVPAALAQMMQAKMAQGAPVAPPAGLMKPPMPQPPMMPPPGVGSAPVAPQVMPGMPPAQNMAHGGKVAMHNKAIQAAIGSPQMSPQRPMPRTPQPNPMMSPVANMAEGGMAKAPTPHGSLKKVVMHYEGGGLVSMPVPQIDPNSKGDAAAAIERGPDPFYTPAPMMPMQTMAEGGMVEPNTQGDSMAFSNPGMPENVNMPKMAMGGMVDPNTQGDSMAYSNPGKPENVMPMMAKGGMIAPNTKAMARSLSNPGKPENVQCYSVGGEVCMNHGGMMKDDGTCMAMGGSVPKLGTGQRFHALADKVQGEGYSKESANAIAAAAGRKSHGQAKMTKWSERGKMK